MLSRHTGLCLDVISHLRWAGLGGSLGGIIATGNQQKCLSIVDVVDGTSNRERGTGVPTQALQEGERELQGSVFLEV